MKYTVTHTDKLTAKRTKNINLGRMRKVVAPTALALAVSIALLGCSSGSSSQVTAYKTVEACVRAHPNDRAICETKYDLALQEAERTAPKYKTLADCQAEFGSNMCQGTPSNGSIFMPLMAGFLFGQVMSSTPLFTSNNRYSPMYRQFYAADGWRYGNYASGGQRSISNRALAPKPAVTRTISRGGFGSQAVAKSAWGGGARSSGFSWGG